MPIFGSNTFAILYEIHRITMIIEVLAAIFLMYIITVMILRSHSWVTVQSRIASRHSSMEFIWTMIPAALITCIINLGVVGIYSTMDVIDVAASYDVLGFQWYWNFSKVDVCMVVQNMLNIGDLRLLDTSSWLVVPAHTAIRLYLSAFDVIHSFTIPSLAIKADCIPGRLNHVTLFTNIPGIYYGQCSELCGSMHGFMPIKIQFT